jgi:hypothetical protein
LTLEQWLIFFDWRWSISTLVPKGLPGYGIKLFDSWLRALFQRFTVGTRTEFFSYRWFNKIPDSEPEFFNFSKFVTVLKYHKYQTCSFINLNITKMLKIDQMLNSTVVSIRIEFVNITIFATFQWCSISCYTCYL